MKQFKWNKEKFERFAYGMPINEMSQEQYYTILRQMAWHIRMFSIIMFGFALIVQEPLISKIALYLGAFGIFVSLLNNPIIHKRLILWIHMRRAKRNES